MNNSNKHKLGSVKTVLVTALVVGSLLICDTASAQGLNGTLTTAQTFIQTIGRTLNILAALTGAFFVLNGLMTWKKSSSDHGGQVEFKSIAVPIVVGGLLMGFSAFVGLTSSTFGFTSAATW